MTRTESQSLQRVEAGVARTQMAVSIPVEMWKATKLYCVSEGYTMQRFVSEALAEKLKKAKK